ncbi:MAG: TadE/TadG family type IV pilus assembly protein [Acidimicrobiales bacterium]
MVEAAITAPLLFVMLFGIIELSLLFAIECAGRGRLRRAERERRRSVATTRTLTSTYSK